MVTFLDLKPKALTSISTGNSSAVKEKTPFSSDETPTDRLTYLGPESMTFAKMMGSLLSLLTTLPETT